MNHVIKKLIKDKTPIYKAGRVTKIFLQNGIEYKANKEGIFENPSDYAKKELEYLAKINDLLVTIEYPAQVTIRDQDEL